MPTTYEQLRAKIVERVPSILDRYHIWSVDENKTLNTEETLQFILSLME